MPYVFRVFVVSHNHIVTFVIYHIFYHINLWRTLADWTIYVRPVYTYNFLQGFPVRSLCMIDVVVVTDSSLFTSARRRKKP